MKKITKKEALEACIDLWTELAETGAGNKPTWAEVYDCRCPACEWTLQHDLDCLECIINWGSDNGHCNNHGSPYRAWLQAASAGELKVAAQAVLNLAKKALEDLEK